MPLRIKLRSAFLHVLWGHFSDLYKELSEMAENAKYPVLSKKRTLGGPKRRKNR